MFFFPWMIPVIWYVVHGAEKFARVMSTIDTTCCIKIREVILQLLVDLIWNDSIDCDKLQVMETGRSVIRYPYRAVMFVVWRVNTEGRLLAPVMKHQNLRVPSNHVVPAKFVVHYHVTFITKVALCVAAVPVTDVTMVYINVKCTTLCGQFKGGKNAIILYKALCCWPQWVHYKL